MTTADWIKTRRELLDAATEGPWFQGREDHRYESAHEVYSKREPDEEDSHDIASYIWSAEDAALITDARTSLPRALDALDAVRALHPRDEESSLDSEYGKGFAKGYNRALCDARSRIESVLRGES